MENKKSLLLLSKSLNWEGLEVTLWSVSTLLGEPFHKCWGWMFPARAWWLLTHQKEVFPLFCVSFCVGQPVTNPGSCSHLSQALAWHPLSNFYCFMACKHLPPHTDPAGKGTYHLSEVLVTSWACLQHFPIFSWKMHHLLKEKARRGLRELCNCAVQKGISSQETATT